MHWRRVEREYDDEVIGESTLPRLFEESVGRNGDRIAQRYKGGVHDRSLPESVVSPAPDGEFATLEYGEMARVVRRLAAGFRAIGVEAGDRVGIFANTRMEWAQVDFGLLATGAVVTTVYAGSSPERAEYLLSDSGATGVVVEDEERLERVLSVADGLDLSFVVVVDRLDGVGTEDRDNREDPMDVEVLTLGGLYERGSETFDREAYEGWIDAIDPGNLATLIYTSGTTGRPKGVELTHRNVRSNVNQARRRFGPRPDRGVDVPSIDTHTRTVSFLPLAHVFERTAGHFLMFASGASVAYAESPDTLREDFQIVRPTTGTSVPRVYETIYDAIRSQAAGSDVKQRIFEWAVDVGQEHHRTASPGPLLETKRTLADRLVFSEVREALGGEIEFLISGGGSLSSELCALYHGMGLPILEGYGLTETAPVVSVNPPEAPEVGTIGPPLFGVDVEVDGSVLGEDSEDDAVGELLVRGPNVTRGYWRNEDATDEAFDGEWFRTGDLVELRENGYIVFRERLKQILVLSTGKNVAPGPIEDRFAASDVVEGCLVLGDGRRFVSALIVPNVEGVREWATNEGVDLPEDDRELRRDDRVRARVEREVDRVNESLEPHERIERFRVVSEEFTEENDLLTPTMKKKRRNILERFADEVESIYEG